jgi:PqqD family protein of HPr-rel-A system
VTQAQFAPPPGLLMAPLGEFWVAYSPLSGETMVINTETAAILEALREWPGDLASVCETLAGEVGLAPAELTSTISAAWIQILEAGLIAETSSAG